ncbi:MAG: hypothetical protein IJM62_02320, partial [Lachnospiraceae bacterium]|nr:hypothetical protein [Lachnospiraceae bacterium]
MKKYISLLLAVLMLFSLAACKSSGGNGGDEVPFGSEVETEKETEPPKDPVIGTWKAVSAEYGGTTMDVPEI